MRNTCRFWLPIFLLGFATVTVSAQSFRVQCPTTTITHPVAANNNSEPAYTGPGVNGAIKCQQISGGDGYSTMGDGTQTYMFSFGPLSGLADIAAGKPGTQFPSVFNTTFPGPFQPGDPATTDVPAGLQIPVGGVGSYLGTFSYNGAVGLALDVANTVTIYDIASSGSTVYVQTNAPLGLNPGDSVVIAGTGATPGIGPYDGTWTVLATNVTSFGSGVTNYGFAAPNNFTFTGPTGPDVNTSSTATASIPRALDGHVDPRQIMDVGVMNGNIPAPLMAIDEDDEFFLTLTNVGMIMRPDLFEQHTVHFHGYPNASSFYDGVPDASVAINIGASFTYYYLAPDAGTYFWHCHITPPEHLQMGMVGQIYVRPRQDRVLAGASLYTALQGQENDLRTACRRAGDGGTTSVTAPTDILCSNPVPAINTGISAVATVVSAAGTTTAGYAYDDGDGSTAYDAEYPIQIHGFDPNFHFVGMTFNPEGFSDMKDKYFLLNGRSYPDTVTAGPLQTVAADGINHMSQPLPAIISMTAGQRVLLRISDLDVTEYQ
ncbi:MAG TPA: multicopper oxidase domain-containing protein, partial [Candidatus Sulfotelmatobacter sp.]|nr:multicopper oxidase domain-containing protein [Candidatus Sulfotelmatobacter sp.]